MIDFIFICDYRSTSEIITCCRCLCGGVCGVQNDCNSKLRTCSLPLTTQLTNINVSSMCVLLSTRLVTLIQ